MHVQRSLRSSLLACIAALVAGTLSGCDDGDAQPRSARVVEIIAEADAQDGRPAPIGEILYCDGDVDEACDETTEQEINTICYCGYVPGKGVVYVETNCAGYPGTHVCCAAACSTDGGGIAGGG